MKKGDNDRLILDYSEAIRLAPDDTDAYFNPVPNKLRVAPPERQLGRI